MNYFKALFAIVLGLILATSRHRVREFKTKEKQGRHVEITKLSTDFTLIKDIVDKGERSLIFSIFDVELRGTSYKGELFAVNESTGLVTTISSLNRDALCESDEYDTSFTNCDITIDILIKDLNDETFLKFQRFKVILEDINDNAPTFNKIYLKVEIPESSKTFSFSVLPAIDKDSGRNANITYKLFRGKGIFELKTSKKADGTTSLKIQLLKQLNYEKKNHYQLNIVASDQGDNILKGNLYVNIEVLDSNDNIPSFGNKKYSTEIREDAAIGKRVIKVQAKDKDVMDNIIYSLSSGLLAVPFRIDPMSGVIYVKAKLDHEIVPTYILKVQASDSYLTTPTETMVIVKIKDVNDNSPEIFLNNIAGGETGAEVRENLEPRTFVTIFRVHDADSGNNGKVTCVLNAWSSRYFFLDKKGQEYYMLYTAKTLDREKRSTYKVTLICSDQGLTPNSASRSFNVNIVDENDNPPTFRSSSYTLRVHENTAKGIVIGQLLAFDPDEGENTVKYYLQNADDAVINIHPTSANVSIKSALDFEVKKQYHYVIVAEDIRNSTLMTTCRLTIKVMDTDDNAPQFKRKQYTFSVYENQPPGSIAGIVSATDIDSNSHLTYELLQEEHGKRTEFTINSASGVVNTKSRLDRERRAIYNLVVKVTSGTMSSDTKVNVYVLDRNDNAPRFLFPAEGNRTLYVLTSAHAGEAVGRLLAIDPDAGVNGEIRYALRSRSDRFKVHEISGRVEILRTATIKEREVEFALEVTARDGGGRTAFGRMRLLLRGRPGRDHKRVKERIRLLNTDFLLVVFAVIVAAILIAVTMTTAMLLFVRRRRVQKRSLAETEGTNSEYAASGSTHTTSGQQATPSNHPIRNLHLSTDIDDVKSNQPETQISPKTLPALPHWYSSPKYPENECNEVVSPLLHATIPRVSPTDQAHFATLQRNNQVYKHDVYS